MEVKASIQPLVSIIIPTFNRANILGQTLDSVIAQSYTNWECIVVDDGSTDNTPELMDFYCKRDCRMQYHRRPQTLPKGANACRNFGYKLSNGLFIQWFDDDDVMLKDFLTCKINGFSTGIDFVICNGVFVDDDLRIETPMKLKEDFDAFKHVITWEQNVVTNSVIFRREFLLGKKLFNTEISRGQETELFSRLFFKKERNSYKVIPQPLFLYRQHGGTVTYKNKKYSRKYKESQAYIAAENLKRSEETGDRDLIIYCYRLLIKYFFQAIEQNHTKNYKYLFKEIFLYLMRINYIKGLEFFLVGGIFILFRKGSYKLRERWLEF